MTVSEVHYAINTVEVQQLTTLKRVIEEEIATALEAFLSSELDPKEALVDSVMGKYAHVPTSSEEFARRKQEEINLEE